MRRILIAASTVLLAGVSLPADTAAQGPRGSAAIAGTVRDSASGAPIARAHVCTLLPAQRGLHWSRCAAVDSSASFRLDSLPAGTFTVRVICGTVRMFGIEIDSADVTLAPAEQARRDWRVGTAGCDPRPLRRVAGEFRGYYTPGFESSEFVPCVEDAWFLPSDSLRTEPYDQRRAWAWLSGARFPERFRGVDAPRDEYGNPRYYVHWRGTVVGPGSYGHMGVSAFELRVDSVMELRAPRARDCAPAQAERGDPRPPESAGSAEDRPGPDTLRPISGTDARRQGRGFRAILPGSRAAESIRITTPGAWLPDHPSWRNRSVPTASGAWRAAFC